MLPLLVVCCCLWIYLCIYLLFFNQKNFTILNCWTNHGHFADSVSNELCERKVVVWYEKLIKTGFLIPELGQGYFVKNWHKFILFNLVYWKNSIETVYNLNQFKNVEEFFETFLKVINLCSVLSYKLAIWCNISCFIKIKNKKNSINSVVA